MRMALLLAVLLLATVAHARDPAQVRAFRKSFPCPSTGLTSGACQGWVVDHVVPLCWGGEDAPANMQWQEVRQSYLKDRFEREACAMKKKYKTGFSADDSVPLPRQRTLDFTGPDIECVDNPGQLPMCRKKKSRRPDFIEEATPTPCNLTYAGCLEILPIEPRAGVPYCYNADTHILSKCENGQ